MKSYQASVDAVIKQYKTDIHQGLSNAEVSKRLERDGLNTLPEGKQRSWLRIFLSQFQSPLIYILLFAAILIFFVGNDPLDAFIISGILFFNAIVGTIQEGRTANIVESLKQFEEATSIVVRNGKKIIIDNEQLVIGDIVLLQEGQRVPADIRIVESNNIQIDQAVLTGESIPVHKIVKPIEKEVPLIDQHNCAFKGTYVLSGSGKGIVIATAQQTELGKIHTVIEHIDTAVPLRKDVDRLSYILLLCVLIICIGLFIIGYLVGKPIQELIIILTALFICVVPEGLPVVLTLVLVSGVYRMAKQFVLVKNMQAVETLGRTDVIVIDKTGTLTRNEMMVSFIYANNTLYTVSGKGYHVDGHVTHNGHHLRKNEVEGTLEQLGRVALLLNNSEITYHKELDLFSIKGDPTESALSIFAQKLSIDTEKLITGYTKIFEIPFSSERKYHAAFYTKDSHVHVFILGAPEIIFERVTRVPEAMAGELDALLSKGLRVVAAATRVLHKDDIPNLTNDTPIDIVTSLISDNCQFLGLIGIEDTIRTEVKYVIAQARNAGLKLVMATGDHPKTALYVARKVGIYTNGDISIDGTQMDKLTDKQLAQQINAVTVFSRVTPLHKMRIIQAFHDTHNIVAMTGDGINDAPSLVAADLGIAMGRIGTEVAKQSADIILLNDSFISIVHAIEQGRHIFYTLKRVILYFFATNMGEILIILFALIWEIMLGTRLPLPLAAAQILWLNLITDGFLDVALSMEPQEKNLLTKNWLVYKPKLVDWAMFGKMLFFAIPMGCVSLYIFLSYYKTNLIYARTMTLITMAMFQWFNAWNCRSNMRSIFQLGLFTNMWLVAATVFVLFLQLCILHIPLLQTLFKTVPLNLYDWIIVIAVSFPIILLEEFRKLLARYWYNE